MASFGDSLRRERELRGVALRDVAEATKISVRFLQALENDRVDILPGGIFPRAFVRQYASYLGLDPERMVAEFLYAHRAPAAPKEPAPPPRTHARRGLMLALLALGVLAFLAWRQARTAGRNAVEEAPAAMLPPTSFPADRVYPPPTPYASPEGSEASGLILALSARQNCWVAVQADGVRVMDRIMSEGETQTLNAKSEIVLSVGNAGGIAFQLNGRPGVPLGKEGEVRRNIVITRQSLPSLVQDGASGLPPRSS